VSSDRIFDSNISILSRPVMAHFFGNLSQKRAPSAQNGRHRRPFHKMAKLPCTPPVHDSAGTAMCSHNRDLSPQTPANFSKTIAVMTESDVAGRTIAVVAGRHPQFAKQRGVAPALQYRLRECARRTITAKMTSFTRGLEYAQATARIFCNTRVQMN
jgi:hypothetical protein